MLSRLAVFRSVFTPVAHISKYCADFVHQRDDDELTMALFCGPWCESAQAAFSSAFEHKHDWKEAFLIAAEFMDRREQALTEDERWELWGGTAWGTVAHFRSGICLCAWLGDCQAFKVRQNKIVSSTTPHTVFHACRAAGNSTVDPKMKRVLTRWLSAQHKMESTEWSLRQDDAVLICSSFVEETLVLNAVSTSPPATLAQEIARLAGVEESRISHCVVATAIVGA
jgi:serine/threonine protein phosphatase PrpC